MTAANTGARPRAMSTLTRMLGRWGAGLLTAGVLATGMTVAVAPGAASAAVDPPGVPVTVFTQSARWADAVVGGWFDGIVTLNPVATVPVINTWTWGLQKTGPDGQTYRRLHHIVSGECLSHSSDVLLTQTCNLADDRQWWAVEEFPCPPNTPICFRMLMKPLDSPGKAVTEDGDVLVLRPRQFPNGVGQRLLIVHIQ